MVIKNIYFVGIYNTESETITDFFRGKYIVNNLIIPNINVKYIKINELKVNDITDSVIILIRGITEHIKKYYELFSELKKNRNIIIHDILDLYSLTNLWYKNKFYCDFENIFDYLIVNSYFMKQILEEYINSNMVVIYHSYDFRLVSSNIVENNVYYYGVPDKLTIKHRYDYIVGKPLPYNINSTVHFTFIEPTHPYFINHTSTKLATALGSNSIFVCNRVPIFIEILGKDYPFFCENEEELHVKIDEARELLNSDKILEFNQKYSEQKIKLSPSITINNYADFFNSIIKLKY